MVPVGFGIHYTKVSSCPLSLSDRPMLWAQKAAMGYI